MVPKSKKNLSILSITLESGGAEKVISLLLEALKNDFNVTLILLYNVIHFPIPETVNVITLSDQKPQRSFFLKVYDSFNFVIKYNRLLKKEAVDYAISFLAFPNLINGIITLFNKNLITVISERGFPTDNVTSKWSYYLSKIFYPIFYNRCTKLFSNSVYINEDLKSNFGIRIPMEVIYNPIILPKETISPALLEATIDDLKVITAGTLNKRKNHIMLLRAIATSQKKFQCTVLGQGYLEQFLQENIERLKLNDCVFLEGKVKNVNDYFMQSHCFVLTSFTEGFPNALLEAMAIGLPSISTNCLSGPLELLNDNEQITIDEGEFYKGKFGLLVNNDDDIGLSKALEFLHSNPNQRAHYSAQGIARSKAYNIDSIYPQFHKFLIN